MDDISTIWITDFLSDGVQHIERKGIFFLACLTEDKERLIVWGSEENYRNIKLVAEQKPPFGIKCLTVEPSPKAASKYGDDIWVNEDDPLGILKDS